MNGTGGPQTCTAYGNVDSAFKGAEDSSCKQIGRTIAGACPTASLDGYCHTDANGTEQEECSYQSDAVSEESSCKSSNGTWTTTL